MSTKPDAQGVLQNVYDSTLNAIRVSRSNTKVVQTGTDATPVVPVVGNDMLILTSLSQTTAFSNPSGSATDGQQLMIRIKSAASQSISWGNQYRGGTDVSLPSVTTGSGKTDYFGFQFDAADTKWDIIGKATGY